MFHMAVKSKWPQIDVQMTTAWPLALQDLNEYNQYILHKL